MYWLKTVYLIAISVNRKYTLFTGISLFNILVIPMFEYPLISKNCSVLLCEINKYIDNCSGFVF